MFLWSEKHSSAFPPSVWCFAYGASWILIFCNSTKPHSLDSGFNLTPESSTLQFRVQYHMGWTHCLPYNWIYRRGLWTLSKHCTERIASSENCNWRIYFGLLSRQVHILRVSVDRQDGIRFRWESLVVQFAKNTWSWRCVLVPNQASQGLSSKDSRMDHLVSLRYCGSQTWRNFTTKGIVHHHNPHHSLLLKNPG